MHINGVLITGLFATTALGLSAYGGVAQAQQAPAAANPGRLEEVVVTATRQTSTTHNVPLSVTAVTPQQLERQGLKTAQDLVTAVTSLRISPVNGGGTAGLNSNPDVAVRGIRSSTGSATTGIYVDDVPLQQRSLNGPTGGGSVFPNLFDLERVEVLKGPQGTLYGGSSEGGTIRFITPSPSFDKNSLYVRAEGASTDGGDASYEGGIAAGGPIVKDKLALRIAAWERHDGGYIDHVSAFTGNLLPGGGNTNSSDHKAVHASIAWKPVDRATVTLSYLYVDNKYRDSDEYWLSYPSYGTSFAGRNYTIPAGQFGAYKSGQNTNIGLNFYQSDAQLSPLLSPHDNRMSIPSLTLDYAFETMNVKSITAYSLTTNSSTPNFSFVDTASRAVTPLEGGANLNPNGPFIPTLPLYSSVFAISSQVKATTEELRFSSSNPENRLSWVGGVFFDYSTLASNAVITANTGDLAAASIIGLPSAAGTPFASLNGIGLVEPQSANETQIAAYGDITYSITSHLKATVGVRYTRDEFNYALSQGGSLFGFAPGVLSSVASGSITESPITPKFGLQYIFNPELNVYATAAKGFRPGGVNQVIPPSCAASLAAAGYSSAPATYGSDSLWSYEAGAKARGLGGRASIEASLFHIDWNGVQTPITLTCGQSFTTAVAKAVSQGAEFQGSVILFPGFTTSVQLSYTDAHYTSNVSSGPGIYLITSGSEIPYTPRWGAVVTGEYRFNLLNRSSYVHADYSWQGAFVTGAGPGTATYTPDAYILPGTTLINARAGMNFDKFKVELFVTNLLESRDLQALNGFASGPGRVNCLTAACTGPAGYQEYAVGGVASTFRPRTIGVDVSYRY